jgi:hypothetical protein
MTKQKQLDLASQGQIDTTRLFGAVRAVPQRSGKAIIRSAGNDVAREDAKQTAPRPSTERLTQDFRRG